MPFPVRRILHNLSSECGVTKTYEFNFHGSVHRNNYSNIYPTRYNFTQFILSGNCSTCGTSTLSITVWLIPDAVDTVVCAPEDGRRYHPKHVEQFPDKINCVKLHLVGYISQ